MQDKTTIDLRINQLNKNKNATKETPGMGITVYPLKATFTSRKNTNIKDKATQNLKQFTTTIMKDPVMLALEEMSSNNPAQSNIQVVNIQQKSVNKKQRNHRKSFMTLNNEALQVLSRIPSLSTKIPTGQFERISINNSQTLIPLQLNESNNNSNRSSMQSLHMIQNYPKPYLENKSTNIQESSQQQNGSVSRKKENNLLQHQQSLQPLAQFNQKQSIQKMSSLNLNSNDKMKKLNMIVSNTNESLSTNQPFLKERQNDNLPLISPRRSSFHEIYQTHQLEYGTKQSTASTTHGRKQSQDLNSINATNELASSNQNQDIANNSNVLNNKQLSTTNANHLSLTAASKVVIDSSTHQTNTLLSNTSKNKLFSESNEDQQLLQGIFVPSSNKMIDTSCIQCSTNAKSVNNQSKPCVHVKLQGKEANIQQQIIKLQKKQQKSEQNSPKKAQSTQNYSPNPFDVENISNYYNQNANVEKQAHHLSQHMQSTGFHSRKGSDQLNQHLGGTIYLTNFSNKTSVYSPKSTYTNIMSPKNKPFYHPFSHQSTVSLGEEQNIASQFFIKNLTKYNQTFSTRKSSSSFRKSFNNSTKIKEDDTTTAIQHQQQQQQNVIQIKPVSSSQNIQSNLKKYIPQQSEQQREYFSKYGSINGSISYKNDQVQESQTLSKNQIENLNLYYQKQKNDSNQFTKSNNLSLKEQNLQTNQNEQNHKDYYEMTNDQIKQGKDQLMGDTSRTGGEEQEGDGSQLKQKRKNLSNLLLGSSSKLIKNQNKKLTQIFQSYLDSKDYLLNSKKLVPQKRKNLLYQYKQNGTHKSSNSLMGIYSNVQQNQQQINSSTQNQEGSNKKRSARSIQESKLNSDKNQYYFATQESQNGFQSKFQQSNTNNQKYKSLSPIKTLQIQITQNEEGSGRTAEKQKIHQNKDIFKKDSLLQQFINNQMNQNLNTSSLSSINKDSTQNENPVKFMTYRERSKNESYQSGVIAHDLVEKKKIDDDPEVADQKIKLSKYFLDENVSLQEKRNNFKDIQTLYLPENKKFDENICREVIQFLNSMKNYFLKYEFYNPSYGSQSYLRSDSKSRLMRGKTGHVVTQFINSEQQSPGQTLSRFANKNLQSGEDKEKGEGQGEQTKNLIKNQHSLMFFAEE